MTARPFSERTLILTPNGRDAQIASALVTEIGQRATVCADVSTLLERLREGAGLAVVTEEALGGAQLARLSAWIESQPSWSDFPFVLLTRSAGGQDRNPAAARLSSVLGNVTFVERPFHPTTLTSAVRSALRGRRRQYEARARMEEIHAREEQLRFGQQAGGVGTFELFADTGTLAVSDTFRELWGLPPTGTVYLRDLVGRVHPEDQPRLLTQHRNQPERALDYIEYRIRRFDTDELRWFARRGEQIGSDAGAVRRIGVTYDITERKQIEERLRASEAQLQALNETLEAQVEQRTRERDRIWSVSHDLLGVADIDGRWINVNPAWTATLGWAMSDIVGRTSEWLEHPDDRAATRSEIMHLGGGGDTRGFENRFRTRGGAYRWFSWTAAKVDELLYCVARDITEMKARQLELERTHDALRQAQKMEAVGQLTGGIAHDFNNLLTGIIGGLDIVRRRIATGRTDDIDRFIDAAVASANRAASLTHRLLAFSRRQSLDPKAIDVAVLIRSMEDLLTRTLGERIALSVALEPALWHARADANQLESALLNLAINARDAMPNGGRLTIEACHAILDEDFVRGAEGLAPGEFIRISVGDSGTGMSDDVIARAFDPFFTTKEIGQGTGLGLSMIYGFARQSGGHVQIESTLGVGTIIRLYLPRSADAPAPESVTAAEPQRAHAGETVLLVEDDAAVRQLVGAVLSELGYALVEAGQADPAIDMLQSDRRIDLLVTDVGLPGMNGRQLAEVARAARPDLRILFITGYAAQAAMRNEFLRPGMDMITKPFALDTLAAKVRQMIAAPVG